MELLFTLQMQLRVFHFQTESHAEHSAFGDTYSAIDALVDEYMEVHMGKYGRPFAKDSFHIELINYSGDINKWVDAFCSALTEELPRSISESDTDLLNIRDEMLASLNKLRYLLTLK